MKRKDTILVGSIETREVLPILDEKSNAVYASPGFLVFAREGLLLAAPFDLKHFKITGEAVSLAESVDYHPYRWNGGFSASDRGLLAYRPGISVGASRLVWMDRSGGRLGQVGSSGDFGGLRLSADGKRCAVEIRGPHSGMMDVWIVELSNGLLSRLTGGPSSFRQPDMVSRWSLDCLCLEQSGALEALPAVVLGYRRRATSLGIGDG